MVQKIKALAVELDDLTSILGTHVVEGQRPSSQRFSSVLHMWTMACTSPK